MMGVVARESSYASPGAGAGAGAGAMAREPSYASPSTGAVRSDHDFARQDLKYRLLRSLSRLNDKDTRVHACEELSGLCEDLEAHQIPMFVSGLQHDLEGQYPFARRECVRLFGVVARCHGADAIPVLPQLISYTLRRFKDQDATVREVAAEVCTAIAGAVAVIPASSEEDNSTGGDKAQSPLLTALFDALKDQNKNVQQTAASAIALVLKEPTVPVHQFAQPHILSKRFGKMLSAKTFHARGEVLLCIAALVERFGAAVFAGGAPLGSVLVNGLRSSSDSTDFGTRKHAVAALLANVFHSGVEEVAHESVVMLRDLRFDRAKPVRDAAIEALKKVKEAGKLPETGSPAPGNENAAQEGSATPPDLPRGRLRSAPRRRVSPLRSRDPDASTEGAVGKGAQDGESEPVESSDGRNEQFFINGKDDTEVVVSASVRAAEKRTRAGAIEPVSQEEKPAWLRRHKNAGGDSSPVGDPSPRNRALPLVESSAEVDAEENDTGEGNAEENGDEENGNEENDAEENDAEGSALRAGLSLKSMPGSPPARTSLNEEDQARLNLVSDQQAEVMRAFAEANEVLTAKNAVLEERLALVESQLAVLLGPVQEEHEKLDRRVGVLEEAVRSAGEAPVGSSGIEMSERVDEIERVLRLAGIPIGDDNYEITAGSPSETLNVKPLDLLKGPEGDADRGGAGAMTPWKIALGKLEQSDIPGAFDTVIAEKDEFLLVRLMGRTGPNVMPDLSGAHLVAVFSALSDLLARGTFKETAIAWTESLIADDQALQRCAESDRAGEGKDDVRVLQLLHDSITNACEAEDPVIAGHATRVQGELRAAAATAGYLEWRSSASPSRMREDK